MLIFLTSFLFSLLFIKFLFFSFFVELTVSISKILSPSETLSPTLIKSFKIFPFSVLGISTLDLSLSIVIRGSFLFISSPSLISTSMTSTSLKSPMLGTFRSIFDIYYNLVGIFLSGLILYFLIASEAYFDAINCSLAKTLKP